MLSPHECEQARLSRDPRFDGLFFILVRTTKIFCRNTCKVRMPLEKNVSYAASAQQALAQGFRPCLRCRPDSAPNSCAWQGTHTTVNRAMKLLSQRSGDKIEAIAERLGISSRYLHKLFSQHLQMSPKRYRLYQQVLMAKNLLQQTSLSVESVAQSVGFSSARQLQHHVKEQLHLSPSQIRGPLVSKANKKEGEQHINAKDSAVEVFLSYRPPYDWPQVRDFFARREIAGNEKVSDNTFCKTLSIDDTEVPVSVIHKPQQYGFTLVFKAIHSVHTLSIMSIIQRMLDLEADPQTIDTALAAAGLNDSQRVSGLRVPGVASAFEAVCRAILGQQVSVAAAVNKVNQLYSHFAEHKNSAFPSAHLVANSDLMFLKMPAKRRQTLIDVAAYFASLGPNTRFSNEALIAIKGIGPWTVSYVDLRANGNTDIWLDSDLIIKQQMAKLRENQQLIQADLAAPWRSYLTLNLWSNA